MGKRFFDSNLFSKNGNWQFFSFFLIWIIAQHRWKHFQVNNPKNGKLFQYGLVMIVYSNSHATTRTSRQTLQHAHTYRCSYIVWQCTNNSLVTDSSVLPQTPLSKPEPGGVGGEGKSSMLFCGQFSPVGKCFSKWPKTSVYFGVF